MIVALIVGVTAGMILSIPPGPIAVAVIKQAVEGKYRRGLIMAVGASLMDVPYTLIAAFASSAIVGHVDLETVSNGYPWAVIVFQVICVIVLLVMGIRYFRTTSADVADTSQREKQEEERARRMGASAFFTGVLIAVTNLASPTFLPFLTGLAAVLHTQGILSEDPLASSLFAVGFGLGAFVWFLIVLRTIYTMRRRIPARFISYIYRFAGGCFIAFALLIAFRVVVATNWTAL